MELYVVCIRVFNPPMTFDGSGTNKTSFHGRLLNSIKRIWCLLLHQDQEELELLGRVLFPSIAH